MKLVKNIILCFSLMMFCVAMVGCGAVQEDFSTEISSECYSYSSGGYTYTAHVITNNSDATLSLSANIVALDSSGNEVGYGNHQIDAIAPGQSVSMTDIFSTENVADYNNTFEATKTYLESCFGVISTTENLSNTSALISVENNTDETVFFLETEVLFFKDGNLVEINGAQLMDNDGELKPGKSISTQLDCYNSETVDEIKVFYTGSLR